MKKLLLCITIILCVCTYGWTAGVPFTGSIDAEDVDYPNTKSISGNPTNVKTAIDGLKTEIDNISAGGLADIDDLPGDTVDDDKIDSSLINNATSTGLGVASFPNTTFTVSTAGAVSIKANVFQPDDADLDSLSSGITGPVLGLGNGNGYQALQLASELALTGTTLGLNTTLDLSGYTITFGLEASDIPDLSGTYQAADTELAAIAALENGSGVLTNDGAGNMSWGAGGSFDISALPANVTTTGIDDYTMPIDDTGTTYKMTWANIIKAVRKSLGLGEAVDGENYIEVSNNTSREPDAGTNQLYPEGNVWKMNSNGVEDTIVGASDLPAIATSIGLEETINIYDSEVLVGQISAVTDGEGVSQLTLSALMGSTMTDFFTLCGNCGVTHVWKPFDTVPIATDGVTISAEDGVVTITGNGDGYDESLAIDLDTLENGATVSSASGVSSLLVDIPFLAQVYTTTIKKSDHPTGRTLLARECNGGLIYSSGGVDITLPDVTAGMSVAIQCISADTGIIDPNGTEYIRLNGTKLTAGNAIDSAGAAGDMIVITYEDSSTWASWGRSGTWTDGGAD